VTVKTHDVKCRALADEFLTNEKWFLGLITEDQRDVAERLANEIQATIEDFLDTKGEL